MNYWLECWSKKYAVFAGPIVLIVFFCLDSQPGDNAYGANPKGM